MSAVSALAAAAALLSAMWWTLGALLRRASRQVRLLRDVLPPGAAPPGPVPPLSVVVTARDEAAEIETTVRRLLEQKYPHLEVIVVDDRSTDGTGAILDGLQREDPTGRLAVIHNAELPPGWLGKCHACRLGAARGAGEWILFMDGDVELAERDLLARVVSAARDSGLDHVAIIPDTRPVSPLQQALMAVFGQVYLLASRAFEMDRDLRRGGAGIGAFNLIRRPAYDRIGGHARLRMDPADDYKLGRLLKESGARQRLFDGVGLVRCRWHRGALNVARGLEKNLFAGSDYSVVQLVLATTGALLTVFAPPLLAIAGALAPPGAAGTGPARAAARIAAFLPFALEALVLLLTFREETRRRGGSAVLLALLYPPAVLLLIAAAWNSAAVTLRRGGIRWRDTFYSLRELRAGRVRAGEGRRAGML